MSYDIVNILPVTGGNNSVFLYRFYNLQFLFLGVNPSAVLGHILLLLGLNEFNN